MSLISRQCLEDSFFSKPASILLTFFVISKRRRKMGITADILKQIVQFKDNPIKLVKPRKEDIGAN